MNKYIMCAIKYNPTNDTTQFCYWVSCLGLLVCYWVSCLGLLVCLLQKTSKLFGFSIFWFWSHLMKRSTVGTHRNAVVCWKIYSPSITNMLSLTNSSIFMIADQIFLYTSQQKKRYKGMLNIFYIEKKKWIKII